MRVFINRPFQRFMRQEGLSDQAVNAAVARAERGLIDADLGGGVIKQRIPRRNEGRSGGFRAVVIFRSNLRSFFVHGFAKKDQENISQGELEDFRELGLILLGCSDEELMRLVDQEKLREVRYGEQDV
jgi:hypothetical protein